VSMSLDLPSPYEVSDGLCYPPPSQFPGLFRFLRPLKAPLDALADALPPVFEVEKAL